MIWDKPIHTVPPAKRLIQGAGFPAGIENIPPSNPGGVDRGKPLTVFANLQHLVDIIHAWAPYIDSAYCISAHQIATPGIQRKIVPSFETTIQSILRNVDLLVITEVKSATEDDLKYLKFILSFRSNRKKITAVDSFEAIKTRKEG